MISARGERFIAGDIHEDLFHDEIYRTNGLTLFFDEVDEKTDLSLWFSGHYHSSLQYDEKQGYGQKFVIHFRKH